MKLLAEVVNLQTSNMSFPACSRPRRRADLYARPATASDASSGPFTPSCWKTSAEKRAVDQRW